MIGEVQELKVAPLPLAAVRGRVNQGNIGTRIRVLLDTLWAEVKTSGIVNLGQTVMLYHDDGTNLFASVAGVEVDVGVLLAEPYAGGGPLIATATPDGRAATVAHFGPYQQLHEAHDAVQAWCGNRGHTLAGPSWELYGHWTDDPAAFRTDVFYLIKTT